MQNTQEELSRVREIFFKIFTLQCEIHSILSGAPDEILIREEPKKSKRGRPPKVLEDTEEVSEDPPESPESGYEKQKPHEAPKTPRGQPKPCCGSVGARHKAGCPYGSGRAENYAPSSPMDEIKTRLSPATPSVGEEDLKDLHAWECIECGKIIESRQTEIDVPCVSCGGTYVQKF